MVRLVYQVSGDAVRPPRFTSKSKANGIAKTIHKWNKKRFNPEVNAPHERKAMNNQAQTPSLETQVNQAREDVASLEQKLSDLQAQVKQAQASREFDKAADLTTRTASLERLIAEQRETLSGLEEALDAQLAGEEEDRQVKALTDLLAKVKAQHSATLEADEAMHKAILNALAQHQKLLAATQEFNDLGSGFDDHNFASGVNLGLYPHSVNLSKKGKRLWKRLGEDADVLKQASPLNGATVTVSKTLETHPMKRILSDLLEDVEAHLRVNS
jgi:uncharacterized coiled-coil protein SlyX